MPKVSNFNVKIDGDQKKIDVYYNKKSSFYCDLDPEVKKLSGLKNTYLRDFQTENELIKKVNEIIEAYHDNLKAVRKVIAYSMSATSAIRYKEFEKHGSSKSYTNPIEGMGGIDGDYGFSISFDVLLEVDRNGKRYYSLNEDGSAGYERSIGSSSWRSDSQTKIIDWTPEREAEFNKICQAIKTIAIKASDTLLDTQKTIDLLDSRSGLLLK